MKPLLRAARAEDTAEILAIYGPYVQHSPVTFEEQVPMANEMISRIENIGKELPFLVCEISGNIAGYAYAAGHRARAAYRWTKESSVYVHPGYRRMKVGFALYSALFSIMQIQGVALVLAGITLPNPESISFHEKFGFIKCAEYHAVGYKLGTWQNVGWWELNLNTGKNPPIENIIPFQKLPPETRNNEFQVAINRYFL